MRKKKKTEIYKQGMKAGAAPFEKKFADTAEQIFKTADHMDEIARNQRKSKKVLDAVIDGVQKNEEDTILLKESARAASEFIKKQQKKIAGIELMMPSIATACGQCGHLIDTHQLVCSNCGATSKVFPYELENFEIADRCIEGVGDLAKTIKDANVLEDDWLYPELEDKLLKMKKIRRISHKAMKKKGEDHAPVYRKIYNISQKFFADYKRRRIEIAVVGTVKAGKSSLINSLIGANLASVDPTPETSILVKYRTTKEGNYLRIRFYTEAQWNRLWTSAENATVFRSEYNRLKADDIKYEYLNKPEKYIQCSTKKLSQIIMEWSKSDAPKHFFVKEIEVGYQSNTIPHDIFLVDTPGLSDPVQYRSDITRRYIKNSDWILACIVGENLSQQPEFNFLSRVIANKGGDVSKIFVVGTKKDMLLNVEAEKKSAEFLQRLGELYNSKSMAVSRFSFVAAECHLLTQKVLSGEDLDDDEYEKLVTALVRMRLGYSDINDKSDTILKYAGVEDLFARIDKVVLQNRRKYIVNSILEDYTKCMKVINDNANLYMDDSKGYLKKLTSNREFDQEQIDALQESNREIAVLQGKVRELKRNLEVEISIHNRK